MEMTELGSKVAVGSGLVQGSEPGRAEVSENVIRVAWKLDRGAGRSKQYGCDCAIY